MHVPLCVRQNGTSALAIAKRLGYISVIDVLKLVTEETVSMVRSLEILLLALNPALASCVHNNHMDAEPVVPPELFHKPDGAAGNLGMAQKKAITEFQELYRGYLENCGKELLNVTSFNILSSTTVLF